MSGASTGAPDSGAPPFTTAVLLSIETRTSAPMRASSFTYENLALKIDSSTTLVPGAVQRTIPSAAADLWENRDTAQ